MRMKKVAALLLAAAMVTTSIPANVVRAEELAPVTEEVVEGPVAEEPVVEETDGSDETKPEESVEETEETKENEETEEVSDDEKSEETEVEKKDTEVVDEGKFPGMPENFTLSNDELTKKKELSCDDETSACSQLSRAIEGQDYEAGVIVYEASDEDYAKEVALAYGAELEQWMCGVATAVLPEGVSVAEAVEAAADMDNNLPAVEPNYTFTINPVDYEVESSDVSVAGIGDRTYWADYKDGDPFLSTTSDSYQWFHEMVESYEAWGMTQGSSNITVAVVDQGANKDHEDLGNISYIEDFTGEKGTFAADHGCNVAGIIGATQNNNKGGAGIAPKTNLMSMKALGNSGSGGSASIAAAINRATEKGANVINMSLESRFYSNGIKSAVQNAINHGVVVVAAAGNQGLNVNTFPAMYNGVIAVGALNRNGVATNFSDYGNWVTVSAPGVRMFSAAAGGADSYCRMNGTSQATPVVSGVVALYLSVAGDGKGDVNGDGKHDAKDVAAVTAAIKKTCTKPSGFTAGMGAGVVNASQLLETVVPTPVITEADGKVVIAFSNNASVNDTADYTIVYTLDGTKPSVVDGVRKNGEIYSAPISISSLPKDGNNKINAIAVTGLSKVSKLATKTVAKAAISGPDVIAEGKTGIFKVVGLGKNVTYKLINDMTGEALPDSIASVNSKGVVTVKPSVDEVSVSIEATDGTIKVSKEFVIIKQVTSIKLTAKQGGVDKEDNAKIDSITPLIITPEIKAGEKDYSAGRDVLLTWKSSNPKIAVVDTENADNVIVKIVGAAKGKVTITATATDSSKASAKLTFDVQPKVESFVLESATKANYISKGGKLTVKPVYTPVAAIDAAVTYKVDDVSAAKGALVTEKGVVSVPKDYSLSEVSVTATLKSDDTKKATLTVKVVPMAKSVSITTDALFGNTIDKKKNVLKGIQLYTVACSNTAYDNEKNSYVYNESTQQLSATLVTGVEDVNNAGVTWKSSNTGIVEVSEDGKVTAHRAGNARITATANDGSKKSASIAVKVIIPASGITAAGKTVTCKVSPTLPSFDNGNSGFTFVGIGKTETMAARVESLYGKPSIKAVKWNVLGAQGSSDLSTYGVKISNKGVLSSSAKNEALKNEIQKEGAFPLYVTATTTDGTNIISYFPVVLCKPATIMKSVPVGRNKAIKVYKQSGSSYVPVTTSDDSELGSQGAWNANLCSNNYQDWAYFMTDSDIDMFTFKADKNTYVRYTDDKGYIISGDTGFYVKNGNTYLHLIKVYYKPVNNSIKPGKRGTASFKITVADGSKKTASYKCKVSYSAVSHD